jgi:hypothetical protein
MFSTPETTIYVLEKIKIRKNQTKIAKFGKIRKTGEKIYIKQILIKKTNIYLLNLNTKKVK